MAVLPVHPAHGSDPEGMTLAATAGGPMTPMLQNAAFGASVAHADLAAHTAQPERRR